MLQYITVQYIILIHNSGPVGLYTLFLRLHSFVCIYIYHYTVYKCIKLCLLLLCVYTLQEPVSGTQSFVFWNYSRSGQQQQQRRQNLTTVGYLFFSPLPDISLCCIHLKKTRKTNRNGNTHGYIGAITLRFPREVFKILYFRDRAVRYFWKSAAIEYNNNKYRTLIKYPLGGPFVFRRRVRLAAPTPTGIGDFLQGNHFRLRVYIYGHCKINSRLSTDSVYNFRSTGGPPVRCHLSTFCRRRIIGRQLDSHRSEWRVLKRPSPSEKQYIYRICTVPTLGCKILFFRPRDLDRRQGFSSGSGDIITRT